MPHYLSIGVSYEKFMDSCPKELKPYDKAHDIAIEEQDQLCHMWWGNYGISALIFAINRCFSSNPKAEYIENSILHDLGLTKGEIEQRELNKFLSQNEKMRDEWKSKHKSR